MNKEKIIIAVLLVVVIWFGATIVRLENYHYAVQVGFCEDSSTLDRDACLNQIETRTNPIYHLLYALGLM